MSMRPIRIFVSRYSPDLHPGGGDKIDWEQGEEVTVVSGPDTGRRFVVLTEGRAHRDLPADLYCREGYFTDDPGRTRWAMAEKALWLG